MPSQYTVVPRNNQPNRHKGLAYDVLRDGVPVASVREDPERTGGRRIYDTASVSLQKLRWAGEMPDDAKDLSWSQRPHHLVFDFVCKSAQTAEEALPEVVEHVERLLAWRAE